MRNELSLAARSAQKPAVPSNLPRGLRRAPQRSGRSAPRSGLEGQGHAKPHRAAVMVHVQRVARQPECLGEVIHDLGVVNAVT
jgi:hypothetical protein